MADNEEHPSDAITHEEINATTLPGHTGPKPLADSQTRNAFTELMSSPQKPTKAVPKSASKAITKQVIPAIPPHAGFTGRNGLGAYISAPTKHPAVIYQNENFVAIYDGFPKSSVHVLLLPRDPTKTLLHPFVAFADPVFLASVQVETKKLRTLVASELRRRYGKDSATEQARLQAMDADPPPENLPPGRDWEKDVMAGIHIGPSMYHLHVHVLSVDRVSASLKHRKHYNSFATPFLVDVEDFPLKEEDERKNEKYLNRDLVCWRCGKGFGSSMVDLKAHLEVEFEAWKKE